MEEGVQAWIVARILIQGTFPSGGPGLKEEALRTGETAQATGLNANGGPVSATATVMPKSEHDVGLWMGRRAGSSREDVTMASNFKVLVHRNGDNLHLKLIGDFDTTSASQLIEILSRLGRHSTRIFIHTATLKEIHPFGAQLFRQDLASIMTDPDPLVFTGEGAAVLSPS